MLFKEFSVADAKKLWLQEDRQEERRLLLGLLRQEGVDISKIKSKLPKEFA